MRYIFIIIMLSVCLLCCAEDKLLPIEDDDYYEGDECEIDGHISTCMKIQDCKPALRDLQRSKRPKSCGFQGSDPLVCCPTESQINSRIIKSDDCKFGHGRRCGKKQRKSLEACAKYHEICEREVSYKKTVTYKFPNDSSYEYDEFAIDDGEDALEGEFPYMALLGFGKNASTAKWQCGGSIISNNFILTAGHCTSHVELGPVSFVVVGTLRRTDSFEDDNRFFVIKNIFKHPDYNPPHKYNDIALLEIEGNMTFSEDILPACLYTDSTPGSITNGTIVGWGSVGYRRELAEILQHAEVHKFSDEECLKVYGPGRLLKQGINSTTQLCYGHRERPKDACPGDSGGPLETSYRLFPCLHTVIGVTSFGKQCGHPGIPGIYTRVQPYLPWIESIVWP